MMHLNGAHIFIKKNLCIKERRERDVVFNE